LSYRGADKPVRWLVTIGEPLGSSVASSSRLFCSGRHWRAPTARTISTLSEPGLTRLVELDQGTTSFVRTYNKRGRAERDTTRPSSFDTHWKPQTRSARALQGCKS